MFYCPEVGRFLSRDLIPRPAANLYTLCGNNPMNRSDATGLSFEIPDSETGYYTSKTMTDPLFGYSFTIRVSKKDTVVQIEKITAKLTCKDKKPKTIKITKIEYFMNVSDKSQDFDDAHSISACGFFEKYFIDYCPCECILEVETVFEAYSGAVTVPGKAKSTGKELDKDGNERGRAFGYVAEATGGDITTKADAAYSESGKATFDPKTKKTVTHKGTAKIKAINATENGKNKCMCTGSELKPGVPAPNAQGQIEVPETFKFPEYK